MFASLNDINSFSKMLSKAHFSLFCLVICAYFKLSYCAASDVICEKSWNIRSFVPYTMYIISIYF